MFGAGSGLLFFPQADWGTANTTAGDMRVTQFIRNKHTTKVKKVRGKSIPAANGFTDNLKKTVTECSGSFSVEAAYEGHGILWEALLGSSTDGGGGGPTYAHTYTPATELPILTMVRMIGGSGGYEELVRGVKLSKAVLDYKSGEGLTAAFDYIAEDSPDGRVAPATSWSAPDLPLVDFGEIDASFSWGGVADWCPETIQVTIDNGLAPRFCAFSTVTEEPGFSAAGRSAQVKMTLWFDSLDAHNAFRADTEGDLTLTWTDGTRTFAITLTNAEMKDWDDDVPDSGPLKASVIWDAQTKGSDAGVSIAITNTQDTATKAGA